MAEFNLRDLKDLIPEYDGDQATLNDFIEACNFASNNIDEDQLEALIFIIKSKLVGKAKRFISSRNLSTIDDIKSLLIGHYGDCRDTEGLLRDLSSCFQKPSETPRAFVQRIEDLLTKLRSSVALDNTLQAAEKQVLNKSHEKIALKTFLAGLNDPLGANIRAQRPQNLDQAEQFLIEEENILYLKNFRISNNTHNLFPRENYGGRGPPANRTQSNFPRQNNAARTSNSNKRTCSFCKKDGHTYEQCFKRQGTLVPNQYANQTNNNFMQ